MIERTVAMAETRRARDRALDVVAGAVDGGVDRETLGEAHCDRGG